MLRVHELGSLFALVIWLFAETNLAAEVTQMDAANFDFAEMIVDAADSDFRSYVSIVEGRIFVTVRLEQVRLTPRTSSGLPDGDITGNWEVHFELKPKLSIRDVRGLTKLDSKDHSPAEQKGLSSKVSLPDLLLKENAFHLIAPNRLLTDVADLQKVEAFIKRLSIGTVLESDGNAEQYLRQRILEP